jgi:uncharacterized protein YjiS (DUF1127 family)
MKNAPLRPPESETTSQSRSSTRVADRTAEMSRAHPRPEEQSPVHARRVGATFIITREAIAQWRRRVRMRTELATLSHGDLHDVRWTRAEVEAECRKPFWRP